MSRASFDPDLTRRDDPAYWAAAAVVADRAGDTGRAKTARVALRRLGYRLDPDQKVDRERAVSDAAG
jgi:hypothetical protein